ncbi:MAG: sugar transferase, partial [archaeon]|nr:sugar transferase [archaeon]
METIKENSIVDSKPISSIKIFFIDFFLLNVSFFLCNFLKRGNFELSEMYVSLLFMFYMCWFISSIMGNKFKSTSLKNYGAGILTFLKSSLYLTYLITFLVVVFGLASYSRIHIFSTCLIIFILDVLFWSMYNKVFTFQKTDEARLKSILTSVKKKNNIAYSLVIMDLLLVIVAFFIVNYLKRGNFELLPDYPKLFMIFLGLWFLTSVVTMKFSIARFQSIYFFVWQWIKAGGMMLATMTILIFGLRLFAFSRFQALGSITLMMVLEIILISFYYRITQDKEAEQDIESVEKVKNVLLQDDLPLDVNIDIIRQKMMEPARNKFKKRVGSNDPELFEFLDQHIDLDDMMRMETSIERSCELFDLDSDRVPVRLFLNQLRMNDIRRINAYFLKMHQLLMAGGYYIGYARTINTHYNWIYKKFPKYIAGLVYLADFCFSRILPKLPGLQKIYFSITNGKN